MSLAIDVSGLNKSFGDKRVVRDFSIQVEEGRICGFLGPNGSGKTTTLRMLCGLLTPDSGQGRCLGFDIREQSDQIKLRTGYMTQRFSLYEDLTIEENLVFTARVWHDTLVARALELMGGAIARAQSRGEVKPGDSRFFAVSLISPILLGVIWRETFVPIGAQPFDLPGLAAQHLETVLAGMLVKGAKP